MLYSRRRRRSFRLFARRDRTIAFSPSLRAIDYLRRRSGAFVRLRRQSGPHTFPDVPLLFTKERGPNFFTVRAHTLPSVRLPRYTQSRCRSPREQFRFKNKKTPYAYLSMRLIVSTLQFSWRTNRFDLSNVIVPTLFFF